jgi:hypothetical protein
VSHESSGGARHHAPVLARLNPGSSHYIVCQCSPRLVHMRARMRSAGRGQCVIPRDGTCAVGGWVMAAHQAWRRRVTLNSTWALRLTQTGLWLTMVMLRFEQLPQWDYGDAGTPPVMGLGPDPCVSKAIIPSVFKYGFLVKK